MTPPDDRTHSVAPELLRVAEACEEAALDVAWRASSEFHTTSCACVRCDYIRRTADEMTAALNDHARAIREGRILEVKLG